MKPLSGCRLRERCLLLVMADGRRHVYDDGKQKKAAELIENADIEDMFHWSYPLEHVDTVGP